MEALQIAIYGAGGFAREVAWLACRIGSAAAPYRVVCFIDDDERLQGTEINDIPVLSLDDAYAQYPQARVVGGIGTPRTREIVMNKALRAGFGFATLIHPNVECSGRIEIGEGTVICAGCTLTTNIRLGQHVQINLHCTVGHDAIMDRFATLAPGVHVSGCVGIGERVYIGTGAVIINGTKDKPITIADDTVIGAGAVVTKSIDEPGHTWVGVPARPIGH